MDDTGRIFSGWRDGQLSQRNPTHAVYAVFYAVASGASRGTEAVRKRLAHARVARLLLQTPKLSPQPQAFFTFGLLYWKVSFKPSQMKSMRVPSTYDKLLLSTKIRTPLDS